jgi:hypothetical protein
LSDSFRFLVAAVGLLLLAVATRTQSDPDLWGHTRFGIDILQTRELPSVDPYSFTQDRPWVNHEWLSELQMGAAYVLGGPAGLALLKGVLTFSALLLVWRTLKGIDLAPRLTVMALTAVSTVPITRPLRPQAWSLLLLVILCRILIEERRRARWLVPILLALWANLHGGWIVGFGVLVSWTIGELLIRERANTPPSVAISVAFLSLLATLLTPYGWRLWEFLLQTVRLGRDITEWRPLFDHPPVETVPWLIAVCASVWFLRRSHPLRVPVAGVLVILAFASYRVMRIAPLFVVTAAMLLSPWIRHRWPAHSSPRRAGLDTPRDQRLIAGGLSMAALMGALFVGWQSLTCVRTEGAWVPDREAARVLNGARPGRLVTFFTWGEYAIWHFGPRLRVSMDGRRETVYSDHRLLEHDAIVRGTEPAFPVLAGWQAEYVWLPSRSSATKAWLLANGYRIDQETDRSFVAVRQDLPALTAAEGKSPAGAVCFPD